MMKIQSFRQTTYSPDHSFLNFKANCRVDLLSLVKLSFAKITCASYAYMLKCILCWNEFVWCMQGIERDMWCVFVSKYIHGTATCHHDWEEHYSLGLLLALVFRPLIHNLRSKTLNIHSVLVNKLFQKVTVVKL